MNMEFCKACGSDLTPDGKCPKCDKTVASMFPPGPKTDPKRFDSGGGMALKVLAVLNFIVAVLFLTSIFGIPFAFGAFVSGCILWAIGSIQNSLETLVNQQNHQIMLAEAVQARKVASRKPNA